MKDMRKELDWSFHIPTREFPSQDGDIEAVVARRRERDGDALFFLRRTDGRMVPMEQRLVYHSPTGMEFGYGGSGPADFALNVLALVVEPVEASRLHMQFKQSSVFSLPRDGGVIPIQAVREWVRSVWIAEKNDPAAMQRDADLKDALKEVEKWERIARGEDQEPDDLSKIVVRGALED